ncbi:hypothetical protein LSAT2_025325 [Lamellibrachia satsuma]|nr:hypothetical protein LSAT2_025325 [Lamellibrachia satsuma]
MTHWRSLPSLHCFIASPVLQMTIMDGSLLEKDGRLIVHLEWINSHLLYNEKYNRLDEVACRQKHQMMREIMALQAENYALEKQLHSYHLSMSRNNGAAASRHPDDHVKGRYRP